MSENILTALEGLNDIKIPDKLKAKGSAESFLLALLNSLKNEPSKLKEIFKKLDVNKEELKNLLEKLPKDEKKEFEKVLNLLDETLKNDNTKTEKSNDKEIKSSQFSKHPQNILSLLLNDINQTPQQKSRPLTKDIDKNINFLKKQIDYEFHIQNIKLTKTQEETFKKITDFKELIDFANKNGLNIKKIVFKQIEQFHIQKHISVKPKISSVNILQQNTKLKEPKTNTKDTKTSLLSHLIGEKAKKENKTKKTQTIDLKIPKIKTKKHHSSDKIEINSPRLKIKHRNNNEKIEINPPKKDESTKKPQKENDSPIIIVQENVNEIKHKIISAKQTLTHFANNLKEAVENYKPPMSKISFEMHPKELGKIEMTLIQRGEHLKIKITSDTPQTVNFFNTHQNELKSVLVNMGYSDVNMSFNQEKQQKEHQQNKKHQQNVIEEETTNDEFIIEIPYTYA